jgi:hypothetical protein
MMRVDIEFYFDEVEDGVSGSARFSRDKVDDLYTMAQMLTDAMRGAGFSYVVNTGFEKDNGEMVFGEI